MTRPPKVRHRNGERPIFNIGATMTATELSHVDQLAAIRGVSRSAVIVEATEVLWVTQLAQR